MPGTHDESKKDVDGRKLIRRLAPDIDKNFVDNFD